MEILKPALWNWFEFSDSSYDSELSSSYSFDSSCSYIKSSDSAIFDMSSRISLIFDLIVALFSSKYYFFCSSGANNNAPELNLGFYSILSILNSYPFASSSLWEELSWLSSAKAMPPIMLRDLGISQDSLLPLFSFLKGLFAYICLSSAFIASTKTNIFGSSPLTFRMSYSKPASTIVPSFRFSGC